MCGGVSRPAATHGTVLVGARGAYNGFGVGRYPADALLLRQVADAQQQGHGHPLLVGPHSKGH